MLGDLLSLEREAGAVLSADLARTQAQLEIAENQNSLLATQLNSLTVQLTDEKTNAAKLENTLATERLRLTTELMTLSARTAEQARELEQIKQTLDEKTQSLKQAATDLSAEQKQSEQARLEIDRLTTAMQSLRSELTRLSTLLAEKQEQSKKDKIAIANLGKELNAALANKVQELQRFRSEFFGRLRTILEGRSDVKVVGDRFVFQSEVLFAPGQANINPEGQAQLGQISDAIMQIIADIPSDIPWILQIEGHTDDIPVSGFYTDNWDLSTERALSVVRFMVDQGVPSERLAATGYGEFQPIASGNSAADRQKNRRIELKLTQTVRAQ
jgi:chemotaxis protein MotB